MMTPEEILLFFKKMKTKDILWLLINAKIDNGAEWLEKKSDALHKWGQSAQRSSHDHL